MTKRGNYRLGKTQQRILAAMQSGEVYIPKDKNEKQALEGRRDKYEGLIGRGIVKRNGNGFVLA